LRKRLLLEGGEIEMEMGTDGLQLLVRAGKGLWRPATVEQALILGRDGAKPARGERQKRNDEDATHDRHRSLSLRPGA
jgi:hypothetical protein